MKYLKITSPDIENGPGCRVTLWIPGCTHKCPGCHNAWTADYNQGKVFDEDAYNELKSILDKPYIKGLTISGGDPMDQDDQTLIDLIQRQICGASSTQHAGSLISSEPQKMGMGPSP